MQRLVFLLVIVGLSLTWAQPASAVTDQEVRQAIARLVKQLYGQQNQAGNWDTGGANPNAEGVQANFYGGPTALVLYALLSAGEQWQKNPPMLTALEHLKKINPTKNFNGSYARGVDAHVWAKLPGSQFGKYLEKDYYWLENSIDMQKGGYAYTPGHNHYDNSITQYAVLGMWEAAKRGHAPGEDYWLAVEKRMLRMQNPDGGWNYNGNGASYGSMTTSGLALLYITLDYAHAQKFVQTGQTDNHKTMQAIMKGVNWMHKNYSPNQNPGKNGHYAYYMVGVERVGLAGGWKYFGGKDWYRTGAEVMVRGGGGGGGDGGKTTDVAFRLIFLSRGRVPVLINKLQIKDYAWNNRPFDVSNLTRWASDEIERSVNWQVVPVETKPQEWLDAPLLWISGHEALNLSNEQKAKLLTYVALGGTIITHADTGSSKFSNSVKELCYELWPQYTLTPVPGDDWIYNINYKVGRPTGFSSVHNGVRHLLVHVNKDVGGDLQTYNTRNMDAWQTLVNIYHYATERGNIRPRLDTHYEYRRNAGGKTIRVAQGKYKGNWNPEPGGWLNQDVFLYNRKNVGAKVEQTELIDLPDSGVALAHVTGTAAHVFSTEEINAIKQYVSDGGVMLFESAGGQLEFTQSVQKMLAQLYPDKPIKPLSRSADVISGQGFGGFNCTRVDYRAFFKMRGAMSTTPLLQAMEFDGHPRILISNEDLSAGMVNQPMWGVFGYDSESARKLMGNIALWAERVNPTRQPAAEGTDAEGEGDADEEGDLTVPEADEAN